jgi:hypothetical protein
MTRFDQLRDAIDSESAWIQARLAERKQLDPEEQNLMKKVLDYAWSAFFSELLDSNKRIIQICDELQQNHVDLPAAKSLIKQELEGTVECSDVKRVIEDFIDAA